jgi:hypothetical protein
MHAGFEYFRAFEKDAKDFALFAQTPLPMSMLVLTGEKASGDFLIQQGRLVATVVSAVPSYPSELRSLTGYYALRAFCYTPSVPAVSRANDVCSAQDERAMSARAGARFSRVLRLPSFAQFWCKRSNAQVRTEFAHCGTAKPNSRVTRASAARESTEKLRQLWD